MAFMERATNQNNQRKSPNNYKSSVNIDKPFCSNCKFQGHTTEKCYKLHGYPPSYKPKFKTKSCCCTQY